MESVEFPNRTCVTPTQVFGDLVLALEAVWVGSGKWCAYRHVDQRCPREQRADI